MMHSTYSLITISNNSQLVDGGVTSPAFVMRIHVQFRQLQFQCASNESSAVLTVPISTSSGQNGESVPKPKVLSRNYRRVNSPTCLSYQY